MTQRARNNLLCSGGPCTAGCLRAHHFPLRGRSSSLRPRLAGPARSASSSCAPRQPGQSPVQRRRGVLALDVRDRVELDGHGVGADVAHDDFKRALECGDSARVQRGEGGEGLFAVVHEHMVPAATAPRDQMRLRVIARKTPNTNEIAKNVRAR